MQTIAKRAWHRLRTLAPEYALYPLIVLIVLLVMGAFTGRFLTTDNPYGSYTIQACAWLEGHLDVNPNFTWLELAEYGGKFYVSFPLFPSYVMLPFAAIFGLDTPDHFINLAVTLLGIAYALRIYRRMTGSSRHGARYVLYLYLANGYLFIALQGWVWFLAQTMCFTLSLMAADAAQRGRSGWALAWWACAVGCRPMAALYLPLLVHLLNQSGVRHSWKRQIANLLPAALIVADIIVAANGGVADMDVRVELVKLFDVRIQHRGQVGAHRVVEGDVHFAAVVSSGIACGFSRTEASSAGRQHGQRHEKREELLHVSFLTFWSRGTKNC